MNFPELNEYSHNNGAMPSTTNGYDHETVSVRYFLNLPSAVW